MKQPLYLCIHLHLILFVSLLGLSFFKVYTLTSTKNEASITYAYMYVILTLTFLCVILQVWQRMATVQGLCTVNQK